MARPTVGGSDGTWGTELNTNLDVSLDADGKVNDGAEQTTSAAPSADAELANKKYVDDQLAAIVGSLTGANNSEGEASIGELQLKWGDKSIASGVDTTIDFTDEGLTDFDNACFQVYPTFFNEPSSAGNVWTTSPTTASFHIEHDTGGSPNIRWLAIGR